MLRTLVVATALGYPAVSAAEQFPRSALHADVVADNGEVVGRVESVERNANGHIIAVAIPGQEPPNAARQPDPLTVERERAQRLLVSEQRREQRAVAAATRAR